MLAHMIGRYVICELFIAGDMLYIREGILMQVTQEFILLLDESSNTRVACDIQAIRVVTEFPPGRRASVMTNTEKCAYLSALVDAHGCCMQDIHRLPAPGALYAETTLHALPETRGTPAMALYERGEHG